MFVHVCIQIFFRRADKVCDCRPLSEDLLSILYRSVPLLLDRLAVDDDLIAEMTTSSCFTENQLTVVRSCAGDSASQVVRQLFDILARRSVQHFWTFVECVRRTQPHLVPLLTGDVGRLSICIPSYD